MKVIASSLVLLALCSPAMVIAQSPAQSASPAPDTASSQSPVTIRKTAQLVAVDVVVTDKQGAPLHGLTEKDFHVFEAGSEQKIRSYEEHRGAVGSASVVTAALDPETFVNQRLNEQSSPLCVILIDSLNTAMSYQSFAHYQLLKLAKTLPAGSRVAVFRLGSKLSMLQGFTEDTSSLIATLNSKAGGPQQGPFFDDADLGLSLSAPDLTAGMGGGSGASHGMAINDLNADVLKSDLTVLMTLRALRTLGLYLSGLPGRKNLVWLSGSFPIDIIPSLGGAGGLAEGDTRQYDALIRDLALLLQSGNISVYPVDVRGIVPGDMFSAARGGAGGASAAVTAQAQSITGLALSNGEMHNTMQIMAALTGGRAYFNTNDISGSIAEAFNDGSNYYSLSYVPTWTNWDGKFRKIEVRLDQKDVRAYYRRGYYAEDPDKRTHSFPGPDPSMGAAMMRGAPETSQISFQLHLKPDSAVRSISIAAPLLETRENVKATPLKGPSQHYVVTYVVKPSDIAFTPAGSDHMHSDLAFSAIAYDASGKILNSSVGVFNKPISAKTYDAVMHDALHISTGIDLPVGRVYLRLGIHDMSTGKIGTLEAALSVGAEDGAQSKKQQ